MKTVCCLGSFLLYSMIANTNSFIIANIYNGDTTNTSTRTKFTEYILLAIFIEQIH